MMSTCTMPPIMRAHVLAGSSQCHIHPSPHSLAPIVVHVKPLQSLRRRRRVMAQKEFRAFTPCCSRLSPLLCNDDKTKTPFTTDDLAFRFCCWQEHEVFLSVIIVAEGERGNTRERPTVRVTRTTHGTSSSWRNARRGHYRHIAVCRRRRRRRITSLVRISTTSNSIHRG
jgi:hypothetical protein